MRTIAKFVCCCGVALLSVTAWPQDAHPSAQERLTKAKQLYTQEGPKAALPEFEEALKMFQANKDRRSEAIVLGYIANCQRKLENLDKALEFAQQALHMKDELGDRDEIGKTKGFVGTGGIVTMSPTDHLGLDLSAFRMLEIKGGDWSLIKPGA